MLDHSKLLLRPVEAEKCETEAEGQQARLLKGESLGSDLPSHSVLSDGESYPASLRELDQQQDAIANSVPGGVENVQYVYPLSPLQEGMLFHHFLSAQGDSYILSGLLEIRSQAQIGALADAIQRVIDRHDALRTAVIWEGLPRPLQVVCRQATLPVVEIALDPSRDSLEQVRNWMRPGQKKLSLQHAPLVRLEVAQSRERTHWYGVLYVHHIVCDHGSMRQILTEMMTCLEGREVDLPAPTQFRDHVIDALSSVDLDLEEEYFRHKLGDVVEPTAPFGLLNVHGDGNELEEASEVLDLALASQIRVQARRVGVSAARLFHAAWALTVAHTSGQDDVVFGTAVLASRHRRSRSECMLGMAVNTLPLRLSLSGITTIELVALADRELSELVRHEKVPLMRAQRCSGVAHPAPLFTSLLNYRRSPREPMLEGATAADVRVIARCDARTNYPITLSIDDMGDCFALTAQADRRIDPMRMIGYLQMALQSLVHALEHAPQTPALSLSILPEAERRQLIELLNATHVCYECDRRVHELFEEHVRRTPDAIATVYGKQALTYAQLNQKANQLARHLRTKGIGLDDLVGICVERGLEMVIGLLGIVKAGAAYLPLDPTYPPERLQYMLQDANPKVVLTQRRLEGLLPATSAVVIALDTMSSEFERIDAENLLPSEIGLRASNLLYVIYTSGSTGRPKGTAMSQGAMSNLIEWHCRDERLGQSRRVLQFAALSFDVAFQETFSALCTGGTLVLLDEWVRKDARALVKLMREHSIERLFVPPLMLQSLAECCDRPDIDLASLRDVITAGEQLRISPEIVSLFARLNECQLHNHYGPTETHVVTALQLVGEPPQWPVLPKIGRPIANTQIYILDERNQPVPLGVTGNIYIGGANLARCYLRRAALTAERFIADPFSADGEGRLYRTGDLGRWQADGTVEYLGRNDDQVKIRGFRIELGEIEAQLALHEAVGETAVVAREEVPGQKRLVAYVTPRDQSHPPRAEDLRAHLKSALPEHMVPSAFVVLECLPLTPSGKLNRRALPAPDLDAYVSREYEPPRGEVEEILASIWQSVLRVERVGRNDNFFELGGHSLLVLNLLFKINRAFNTELLITDLYKNPTIAQLAQRAVGDAADDEFVDLKQEAHLPDDIVATLGDLRVPAEAILLTGATGFVGRFLLAELLEETEATVYCLVRAASHDQAAARLRNILQEWDLWQEQFNARLVAVAGDLRLPRLGVDPATYQMLTQSIDSIYHCGASMNHLETYTMAKRANVDAAVELLRFATEHRPKLINYVSTLGVFSPMSSRAARIVDELSAIDDERHLSSQGYTASKWVGEKIFLTARERGINCNIFRLGLVWADSKLGRYDELQREYRIIKSCLLSGYGILDYQYNPMPIPVDYAARAMVFLANKYHGGHGIFHISTFGQLKEGVFERCNQIPGISLKLLPMYEWICQIKRLHEEGRSLPIVPLVEFAFSMNAQSFAEYQQSLRKPNVHVDCTRTHRELAEAGIIAPDMSHDLIGACVETLRTRDVEAGQSFDTKGAVPVDAQVFQTRRAGKTEPSL